MAGTTMNKETFFMGLLLRLQPTGGGHPKAFSASGDVLSNALSAALKKAHDAKDGPSRIDGIDWGVADDPVRLSRFVAELLAFGMSARLLRLYNVDLETAQPRPRSSSTLARLTGLVGHDAWFGEVGREFVSKLT